MHLKEQMDRIYGELAGEVCFSEDDPGFEGAGNFRTTPLGTTLYFSSERELRELFEPLFDVEELRTVEVPGKYQPHLAVAALMTRREPSGGGTTAP